MPVTVSYPGVYIEEIPSGVRTITGVATSITAFVGRALRGPVNRAVPINSFADFERIFGGLWVDSTLGFAVRDYYLNGGQQAVVVRLFHADTGDNAPAAKSSLDVGNLTFEAAYEGEWGAGLRAIVDGNVSPDVAADMGLAANQLFNLVVLDSATGVAERFLNVSLAPSPRRIDQVLAAESRLVRWRGTFDPANLPTLPDLSGGKTATDVVTAAEQKLAALKRAVPPDQAAINAAKQELDAAVKARLDAVSDGGRLVAQDFSPQNGQRDKKGLYALEQVDLFNLLCLPPYLANGNVDPAIVAEAAAYCEARRAMLIVDPPVGWIDKETARSQFADPTQDVIGTRSQNAALYFPRVRQPNPLHQNRLEDFVPCGVVAGIFARTDTQRGVWKAPAGIDATLVGVPQLTVNLTDAENGELNLMGVNCLRALPAAGRVVWGARTLRGDDRLASEWKYVPIRRLALYIEESLFRGTQWVVFEPNDEPLWAQIRLNVGAFMHSLFLKGAFQGTTPAEAYFVKCDKETTTQDDRNRGIVNIIVGFAPLKPAEFVIIKLQQIAGQIES